MEDSKMDINRSINKLMFVLLLFLTTGGIQAQNKPSVEGKMNVLLIMVDDLNTMVGSFNGPAITPNIDRFAEKALKFTNAYAPVPSCNPSRAAILTGKRPEETKVFNNTIHFRSTPESKDLITLPQLLKANGYNTIAAGKIFHHRRNGRKEPDPQSDPISWSFQADIKSGLFFGRDFKKEFLDENGVPLWVRRGFGMPDAEAKKKIKTTWAYGPTDVEPTNTLDFNTAEFGRAYLNKDNSEPEVEKAPNIDEKPFFLALGIFRPHIPLIAPKVFFDMYTTEENKHRLELPNFPENDLDDLPKGAKAGKDWFVKYLKPYPEEHKRLRHAYMASTTYADAAVGIILEGLEKSGLAHNTIVILMGDHGYQLGEKDRLGKAVLWKKSTHTPLLIKVPSKPIGTTNEPVSLIDIYPTLLELLNIKQVDSLAGESLMPLINNPKAERDVPVIITSATRTKDIAIVQDNWNYISYISGDEELYNHILDPKEEDNLLAPNKTSAKYKKIALELSKYVPKNRAK